MTKKSTADISAHLGRAQELAARLAASSDALNASIRVAEERIAALKLGVSAQVTLEADDESTDFFDLGWMKVDKTWGFVVFRGTYLDGGDSQTFEPLHNAPRRLRLIAWEKIPALIEKLVASAEL